MTTRISTSAAVMMGEAYADEQQLPAPPTTEPKKETP